MTKEQAIDIIKCLAWHERPDEESIEQAIKALEQQPSDCKIFGHKENCFGGATENECNHCDYKIQAPEKPTSEDCVSRAEMLKYQQYLCGKMPNEENQKLWEFIKALPPVAPTQSWIPVSEKLPEDRNLVLVTTYWHETYQVMMASYFGDGLWWCVPFNNCGDHMQKLNPKAWQPLPKPYEEKRGSENGSN